RTRRRLPAVGPGQPAHAVALRRALSATRSLVAGAVTLCIRAHGVRGSAGAPVFAAGPRDGRSARPGEALMSPFDYAEMTRRNIGFVTEAEQAKLRAARVFVCGTGGMGGACLQSLVRA